MSDGGSRTLATALRVAAAAVLALAAAALVLPGRAGTWSGSAMVGLLVAVPVARVGWLTYGWWRRGDRRFGVWGSVLLLLIAAGVSVAFAVTG